VDPSTIPRVDVAYQVPAEQRQQHLHAKCAKRAASRFYQQNQYPPPSHQYHNQLWQRQQQPLPPQQQPKNHQEHANLARRNQNQNGTTRAANGWQQPKPESIRLWDMNWNLDITKSSME